MNSTLPSTSDTVPSTWLWIDSSFAPHPLSLDNLTSWAYFVGLFLHLNPLGSELFNSTAHISTCILSFLPRYFKSGQRLPSSLHRPSMLSLSSLLMFSTDQIVNRNGILSSVSLSTTTQVISQDLHHHNFHPLGIFKGTFSMPSLGILPARTLTCNAWCKSFGSASPESRSCLQLTNCSFVVPSLRCLFSFFWSATVV